MSTNTKKLEVLIATIHNDISIIEKNNINANFIIANQTDHTDYKVYEKGVIISTQTKGVGINRNIALMYSSSKYVLFSDDDVYYINDLEKHIEEAFQKVSKADVLIFNIETIGDNCNRRKNTKIKRVRWYNFLNYGAVRIAANREKIIQKNIWFSPLFGGGTQYSCGEDTLFLSDCLKRKLKIYTYPLTICRVNQEKSSWFTGYNEKYFHDKGVLLKVVFPKTYRLFIWYYSYKFRTKDIGFKKIKKYCLMGAKEI